MEVITMSRMTAMCGLDCAGCDGYLATQTNDEVAKETAAARWRSEYGNPNVNAAYVTCDGCLSTGRLGGHCPECEIRLCGLALNIPNCGHCPDYASCTTIAEWLDHAPYLKPVFDEIRTTL
jgi:hypothetical protein